MATTRLTFLYPHLFRSTGRWSEPAALSQVSQAVRRPRRRPQHHVSSFTTTSIGGQAAFAKRAGKGVEPLPTHETAELPPKTTTPESEDKKGATSPAEDKKVASPADITTTADEKDTVTTSEKKTKQPHPTSPPPAKPPPPPPPPPPRTIQLPPPAEIDPVTQTKKGSIMDEILHLGPPPSSLPPSSPQPSDPPSATLSEPSPEGTSPPVSTLSPSATANQPRQHHLTPPPYVHHFDSYSLVKHLTSSQYTLAQSIALMKAVRTILAQNLDVAQSDLVSKSDVENETYLFRAACSELSAEVRNNRRVADEQMRQQRTHLQHEVDILTQQLNQDLLTLTDNVRGMFNDRKMAVREEQKAVESRIQQINYKISVMLNSDARSDIEGLRWVLIRRSVLGIIFMAVLTLGTLRYATFLSHQRQEEAKRKEKEKEEMRLSNGKQDHSPAPEAAQILAAS